MAGTPNPLRCAALTLALLLAVACQEVVLHDLSEAEANTALLALKEAGLFATKSRSRAGYQIEVPRAEESLALRVLKEARLPRPKPPSYSEEALFPSPEQEASARRARLALALSQDLEAIGGILEARVKLAPGREARPSLWEEKSQAAPSAAVLYRYQSGTKIPEEKVRALVCAALGEASCQKIEVLAIPVEPPEAQNPFTYVGPFAVAPQSAQKLLWALCGCLLLLLASFCFGAFALLRRRRLSLQEEPPPLAASPEEEPVPGD